ncbi:MAG: hypothetical protein JXA04_12290 [Gammaproteobacteria bacterium]|nr:hypothetical protein [Gammaproteobacteria bacterium]
MNKNQSNAWKAICELGDYFSRLGGAARPRNMAESEIFLFIICKLIEKNNKKFEPNEFLDHLFCESAEPVLDKVNSHLSQVLLSAEDFIPFVTDIYNYADSKLGCIDKTNRWVNIGKYIKTM